MASQYTANVTVKRNWDDFGFRYTVSIQEERGGVVDKFSGWRPTYSWAAKVGKLKAKRAIKSIERQPNQFTVEG